EFESGLLIRCPRPGDGRVVHASVSESLSSLRQFPVSLPWAMEAPSLDAAERFCREGLANFLRRADMPMLLFCVQPPRTPRTSAIAVFIALTGRCRNASSASGFALRTAAAV